MGLIFSEIVLTALIFLAATYLVFPTNAEILLWYEDGFTRIAFVVAAIILGFYFQDLYTDLRIQSSITLLQQMILTVGLVLLSQAFIAYLLPDLIMSRFVLMAGCLMFVILLPLWRLAYTRVVYKGLGIQHLLFVGTNSVALEIVERIRQEHELGFRIAGFIDDAHEAGSTILDVPVLGKVAELPAIASQLRPDRIVVGLVERRNSLPVYQLLDLRFSGIHIEDVTTTYETVFGRVATRTLRPSQLIFSTELGASRWSLQLQKVYSALIGLIGLIVASPLMLLTVILVKLTSTGPALYKQRRVGLNGSTFTVYKFRSMVIDAEKKTGAVWATRNDPRITPVGKFIRKTRLDELPQLFNVLKGEMVIVGPRPERPEFVKTLSEQIPFYPHRHSVKPGLTGWAQINYKYGETLEDTIVKLEYDLYYIKNLSMSLDLYIMFNTIKTMVLTRGAN